MIYSARRAALEALERCRRTGAWSGAALDAVSTKYGLDGRDTALASSICLGTLQNMALCDYYIDCFSDGKSSIEPKVRDILRTAVYQLFFMDRIPESAAVNESVKLCKALGYARAAGFVNAVLRRAAKSADALPELSAVPGTAEYLSLRYSHPLWLVERLIAERGYDFASAFLCADNHPAKTTIQVNTLKNTQEELEARLEDAGIAYSRHEWLPGCLAVGGSITKLPGFDEGLFYVQDPAARAAVGIAGLRPGMSVLDACAAPGGKSFAAAVAMQNSGRISACDIHEKKLGLISSGADRLGIDIISTSAADARTPRAELFDAVLADVPCSGLGVIRKKPEIRYKKPDELASLPEIQSKILQNLSACVKPGGVLLYSTCTVLRAENEAVIEGFLTANADFSASEFSLPHKGAVKSGMYTFWPNEDDTDGFFVCRLRRAE